MKRSLAEQEAIAYAEYDRAWKSLINNFGHEPRAIMRLASQAILEARAEAAGKPAADRAKVEKFLAPVVRSLHWARAQLGLADDQPSTEPN